MGMMTSDEAKEFASKWLPAWTGNDPEGLAAFYSEDAFYLDPAIPEGVRGKADLLAYFSDLDPNLDQLRGDLVVTKDWSDKEFINVSKKLKK